MSGKRKLVPFSCHLYEDQLDALDEHKKATGTSLARAVREAIDRELARLRGEGSVPRKVPDTATCTCGEPIGPGLVWTCRRCWEQAGRPASETRRRR